MTARPVCATITITYDDGTFLDMDLDRVDETWFKDEILRGEPDEDGWSDCTITKRRVACIKGRVAQR